MNAYMSRGFETLGFGIPEHLLVLLASFAQRVPQGDPRYFSTLDLIEKSLYEANIRFMDRNADASRELKEQHTTQLSDLLLLVKEPWQAISIVQQMSDVVGEDEYQRRVWGKALSYNTFDQNKPLSTGNAHRPGLEELRDEAVILEGGIPTSVTSDPEIGSRATVGVPFRTHSWKPDISHRLSTDTSKTKK